MQASKFAKKYVVIRNRNWFNKLRQLFSVTKSVFFFSPKNASTHAKQFHGSSDADSAVRFLRQASVSVQPRVSIQLLK